MQSLFFIWFLFRFLFFFPLCATRLLLLYFFFFYLFLRPFNLFILLQKGGSFSPLSFFFSLYFRFCSIKCYLHNNQPRHPLLFKYTQKLLRQLFIESIIIRSCYLYLSLNLNLFFFFLAPRLPRWCFTTNSRFT